MTANILPCKPAAVCDPLFHSPADLPLPGKGIICSQTFLETSHPKNRRFLSWWPHGLHRDHKKEKLTSCSNLLILLANLDLVLNLRRIAKTVGADHFRSFCSRTKSSGFKFFKQRRIYEQGKEWSSQRSCHTQRCEKAPNRWVHGPVHHTRYATTKSQIV